MVDVDGQKFISSPSGARFYCMRVQVYGSALLVWLIKVVTNGGSNTDVEFRIYLSIIVAFIVLLAVIYHVCPPPRLRMRMLIDGDFLFLEKPFRKTRIPISTIRNIIIHRSWRGRFRIVRVSDGAGTLYELVNPKEGDLLEQWATDLATRERVPVTIRMSWFLTFEPVSSLVCCLFLVFILSTLLVT